MWRFCKILDHFLLVYTGCARKNRYERICQYLKTYIILNILKIYITNILQQYTYKNIFLKIWPLNVNIAADSFFRSLWSNSRHPLTNYCYFWMEEDHPLILSTDHCLLHFLCVRKQPVSLNEGSAYYRVDRCTYSGQTAPKTVCSNVLTLWVISASKYVINWA